MNRICLYGVGGAMAGAIFDLDMETTVIGRDPRQCAIVYPDQEPGISNIHCQIQKFFDYVEITDLGSTYGTFLENGVKLKKGAPYILNNGEIFYVGDKKNKYMVKVYR